MADNNKGINFISGKEINISTGVAGNTLIDVYMKRDLEWVTGESNGQAITTTTNPHSEITWESC